MPRVYDTPELCILEATGGKGVHLTKFSSYVPKHLGAYFSKIVLKHLTFERTHEHIKKLYDFLDKTENSGYSFKPSALKKHYTEVGAQTELEGRNFFCSELIAEAFKYCGILKPTNEASSNFFPCNFSSDKWTLPLEDGISYDPE